MGENILRGIGRPGLIAQTVEDYVASAVALAGDLPALADERQGLRARLLASPICDLDGFADDLATAFDGMWQAWCSEQRSEPAVSAATALG
jgi:predicted O-linked N-acetylglucosamine transferase (SPINDLY family)